MIASSLTSYDFRNWRLKMGYGHKLCAKSLGISISSVFAYESGRRKEGDVKIPITVALAMSALEHDLKPYGEHL